MKNIRRTIGILIFSIILSTTISWNLKIEGAPSTDASLGQICLMAFSFAPFGWAECNGSVINITQNSALYGLLGTKFGGNGTTTFALPNLQSPIPGVKYYIATQGLYPSSYGLGSDSVIGQIELLPYSFTMSDYPRCEGQTLQIRQYQALYSIIGTAFGGDGQTTFKLPDLRGTEPNENLHYCISTSGLYPMEGEYSYSGAIENYIGSINLFTKIPRFETDGSISNGICNGDLMNIATNNSLFALTGIMYGGDGRTTFAKPDLRGAVPDPKLSYYIQVDGAFPQRQ